jgi:hypothetical protein
VPALVLLTSGVLAGVSGTVSCSSGCPLPPFEPPTAGDVIHGGASVIGVGLCALAMLLLALGRAASGLRRLSRIALIPVIPAGLLNAYGIAFVGRGRSPAPWSGSAGPHRRLVRGRGPARRQLAPMRP